MLPVITVIALMNCCCRKRQQHLQAYYSTLTKTHTCVHRDRTDRLTERHRLTNTKQCSQRCTWKTVGWIFHQISDCTWPYLSDALWKKISTTSSCSAYVHFPMKLDQYSVLSSSLTDYGWTHDNCTVLFLAGLWKSAADSKYDLGLVRETEC